MAKISRELLPVVLVLVVIGELLFFIFASPAAHAIDIPPKHRRPTAAFQHGDSTSKTVTLVMPAGSKTDWFASKITKHAPGMGGVDTIFVESGTGDTIKILGMGTVIIREPARPSPSESPTTPAEQER